MTAQTSTPTKTESLKNARVTFTGKLASMPRREAHRAVIDAGGEPSNQVSRRTSLLVVGLEGWPLLPDGTISNKLRRAEELRGQGAEIRVASEVHFLELLGLEEPASRVEKTYRAEQICDMVDISPDTLRRWELLSLIESHEGLYDYQDIVSLRTIADLVQDGVRPEVIASNLRRLRSVLPHVDRPLAQLKIVTEGPDSLLAEIGDICLTSDGQLTLDYDDKAAEPPIALSRQHDLTAAEWLEQGCEAEEHDRFDQAEHAFRKAIVLEPYCAEAYFNLGNVLREQNRLDASAESFRTANAHDPSFALAHYNLADVLEDQGKLSEAIQALHAAIKVSPAFGDAHFNLAHLYEQAGRQSEARHHWTAYLKLDPNSEYAEAARQRSKAIARSVSRT